MPSFECVSPYMFFLQKPCRHSLCWILQPYKLRTVRQSPFCFLKLAVCHQLFLHSYSHFHSPLSNSVYFTIRLQLLVLHGIILIASWKWTSQVKVIAYILLCDELTSIVMKQSKTYNIAEFYNYRFGIVADWRNLLVNFCTCRIRNLANTSFFY